MYTIEVNAKCVYSNILENDRMSLALVEKLKAEIMEPRKTRIDTKGGRGRKS
jgi:hypothetical protein